MTITTFDAEGNSFDRVLSGLESGGQFYVAVNHWPRAWYRRLLENPEVRIMRNDQTRDYLAIRVSGEEAARVEREYPRGPVVGFLMGFCAPVLHQAGSRRRLIAGSGEPSCARLIRRRRTAGANRVAAALPGAAPW